MYQAGFHELEAAATATFLNGRTFAEVYALGHQDEGFMSTERLLERAKAAGEVAKDGVEQITAAELRGWLYHKLGVGAAFGEDKDKGAEGDASTDVKNTDMTEVRSTFLIANRDVVDFGDCFNVFDVTDFLDPPPTTEGGTPVTSALPAPGQGGATGVLYQEVKKVDRSMSSKAPSFKIRRAVSPTTDDSSSILVVDV
jgi:hypothetical protein